ncbi:MAG: thermonuclease family protein [Candidatus Omnitrophota bacterium]
MRFFKKSLILFLILFFCGCNIFNLDNKYFKVVDVVDGDTIKLDNGWVVRYIGINTPETRIHVGNNWVFKPQPYAVEAKEFNKKLVQDKLIRLEFDVQRKDKYGRVLAYCFAKSSNDSKEEVFVNQEIVEQGYAMIYTMPPNVKFVDLFVRAQKEARENNRGLWQVSSIIRPREAKDHIGEVRTIEGQILKVIFTRNVVKLDFAKSSLNAIIFKKNQMFFSNENIDFEDYKGRFVRITGLIKEYKNEPEIIIDHPSQIEVRE